MLDQYATCQCGSGKKFKWCCQPISPAIQQAVHLDEAGQHEAALRVMEKLTQDHPANPEAWGQLARLLYVNNKGEAAEEALEKAFALNPNYPFGLMLRARMRHDEGEFLGALGLARRAADAYDPQTKSVLAELYYLVFDCEMRRNNPVAARAALEQVTAAQPAEQELREGFEAVFGDGGRLPPAARKKYELRKPAAARRAAWDAVLSGSAARLSDLARAFDTLTQQDANDAPAWFNLGLARAWLGENAKALEALDRYIDLEPDESAAAEAALLGEVLRCGLGLEEQSDYCEYAAVLPLRNPEPINRLLNEWAESRRLIPLQTQEQNVFTALVLEVSTGGLVTIGRPAADVGRLAAYLIIVGSMMRLSGPVQETFERLRDEVRQKLSLGLTDLEIRKGPIQFHDISSEAAVFPVGPVTDQEQALERAVEQAGRFYEETWIHRPRKSLNSIAPIDAVGSPRLRKKLRGVIDFTEQCARSGVVAGYDFNRLRRKLGLTEGAAAPSAPAGTPADFSALSAAELAAVPADSLSDEQLEQAYQAAHRLDAQELAANFARTLVARPASATRPDRYPWHLFLVQKALRDGELQQALDQVNEGERADCEHNGGKRRNDFELLRARVHTKRGEAQQARDVFASLIERTPRDFEVRGHAAKAMLDLRDAPAALKFAEEGVAAARQANNRDAEQMLLELTAAAKKAGA